jgi:hypothetical protein
MIEIKVGVESAVYSRFVDSAEKKRIAINLEIPRETQLTFVRPRLKIPTDLAIAHECGHIACFKAGHRHAAKSSTQWRGFRELSEAEACAWRWAARKRGGFTKREGRVVALCLEGYLSWRKHRLATDRKLAKI